jgi:D-alanine--poly(phosphoribitol) ligase subunit 2
LSNINSITERLGVLFAESFHIEIPSPETDLLETGILDSFQFVELLFQLEQHFDFRVKIEDLDLDDIRTLARIARLVAANAGEAGSLAAVPSSGTAD